MNCPSCHTVCTEVSNYCHNCGFFLKPFSKDKNSIPAYNVFTKRNDSVSEALKRLMPASYVEKLLASEGKSEGERRVVTILFSDVKGSTSMGENLDPEEVLHIMNNAFGVLIDPVMKYEGTLARLMGDAILAFFGAPVAHEDDPQRACRAALDIVEGIKKFSFSLEAEKGIKGFTVRVGINTGMVVVAEVGADLRVEYTAMGDAVNVAARMETSAEPGTILITEETMKLLGNSFDLQPMGPIVVKGRTRPVNTYRVLSEINFPAQRHNAEQSPLIGRGVLLKDLMKIFNGIIDKKGAIISLVGECGFGKSRIISEIRKRTGTDFYWLEAKALGYQQGNSYWLIKNLIKNDLCRESSLTDSNISTCLKKRIQGKSKNSSYIYSFLCYLLDVQPDDYLPLQYDLSDAGSLRGQIHYSVTEYLKFCFAGKKVVLHFEDLQWCDSASLDLISDILSLTAVNPIIVLLTYRSNEGEIQNMQNRCRQSLYSGLSNIFNIDPLTLNESIMLLEKLSADLSLSENIRGEILKKADGNPFYIEEIVKSIREGHAAGRLGPDEFPETGNLLQGVIMSRIDYLSPADKLVLQTASVFGRAFGKKYLQNVLSERSPEELTKNSIPRLVEKEFLVEQSEEEFLFKQSIIQEVAYNSLLRSKREKIHFKIAELMDSIPEEFPADAVGMHYEKAKVNNKSVIYYMKAAERAKEIFANRQALSFYERILVLSEKINADNKLLLDVYESCGDIRCLIADYSAGLEDYEKALKFAVSPADTGRIHQKKGNLFEKRANYNKALEEYDISLKYLQDAESTGLEAGSYIGKGMVYYREGLMDKATTFTLKALGLLEISPYSTELSRCYNNLGIIYGKTGKFGPAEEYMHKALRIRAETGSTAGLASSYNNLGYLYQLQEKNTEAVDNYNTALEYCEKTGNIHALAKIYDNLSNIFISINEMEKAISYNLKAVEILGRISMKDSELNQHLWLQSGVWQ